MTKKGNGTDAKEVALYFIALTQEGRATPAIVAKTISQAKNILKAGYTKEEVIKVMDYVVSKGVNMYSIGYVSTCINDVLREVNKEEVKRKAKEIIEQQEKEQSQVRKVVTSDGESTERNKDKARRLGVQSRVRKKFDFDMFEEQ